MHIGHKLFLYYAIGNVARFELVNYEFYRYSEMTTVHTIYVNDNTTPGYEILAITIRIQISYASLAIVLRPELHILPAVHCHLGY